MSLSTEKTADQVKHRNSGFQEDLEKLWQAPMFHRLEPDCLKLLTMLCKRIDFVVDDELMVQGEDDGNAYLIMTGQLSAIYSAKSGSHVIRNYESGELVGGCALLGRMLRHFTLKATQNTTALQLSREDFQKVMQQFPKNVALFASSLISELVDWDRILLERQQAEGKFDSRTLGISLL